MSLGKDRRVRKMEEGAGLTLVPLQNSTFCEAARSAVCNCGVDVLLNMFCCTLALGQRNWHCQAKTRQ